MKKLILNLCVIIELIFSCLFILASVYSLFLPEAPAVERQIYYPMNEWEVTSADSLVMKDSLMQVSVYDRGLQMWQGSYTLPRGWRMRHEVATNTPSGDHYDIFQLSFHGPKGEVIKSLGYSLYNQLGNRKQPESFEEEWQSTLQQGLSTLLDTYEQGKLQVTVPHAIHYLSPYLNTESSWQYLQAEIHGQKDGKAYEGVVRLTNISPEVDWLNNFCMSVTLSPGSSLQQTLATEVQIAGSYEANPAFERAKHRQQEAYLRGETELPSSLSLK